MTEPKELSDKIEHAYFPYITDPRKRRRLADLAATIAAEHARAALQSPTATDPKEPQ